MLLFFLWIITNSEKQGLQRWVFIWFPLSKRYIFTVHSFRRWDRWLVTIHLWEMFSLRTWTFTTFSPMQWLSPLSSELLDVVANCRRHNSWLSRWRGFTTRLDSRNMLRGFFVANDILLFAFFLGKSSMIPLIVMANHLSSLQRRRLVLDTLAYVALNFAHEQTSQWQLALQMRHPTTDSGCGVSLAACEKASLWREALQLIKDMKSSRSEDSLVHFFLVLIEFW